MGRLLALAAILWIALCGSVPAQENNEVPNYDAWQRVAERVEALIADPEATTQQLEDIRDDLADWRGRLLRAETVNGARIDTIKAQINALGPAPDPEKGTAEPDGVARTRIDLNEKLEELLEPRLQATEAYTYADGLINEIDAQIAQRTAEELVTVGPSPLNPANWWEAILSLQRLSMRITSEVTTAVSEAFKEGEFGENALATGLFFLVAVVLLVRGRLWMSGLTDWVQSRERAHGRIALGFLISLGQVAVPVLGFVLLVASLVASGFAGEVGTSLLRSLAGLVSSAYVALWLVGRLFPPRDDVPAFFDVPPEDRRGARIVGIMIGILNGIAVIVRDLASFDEVSRQAEFVLALPVFFALGYCFWRLARIFRKARRALPEDETPTFGMWLADILARALIILAIVGPLVAAAGFANLADAIMFPTASTLGLLGLFFALQMPIRDLYAWATGKTLEEAGDALVPVLVNFALALAGIPILALVWGMRVSQLREIYARFSEGMMVGDTRLTPTVVITVVVVFLLGYAATRLLQGALRSTVLPRTSMEIGAQTAITSFIGYVGIGLAALLAITSGGIDLTALAVVFGALSVGIGFGLQNVVQNFIAGIILLVERPISEGDWIEVAGNMGIVKDISVRSTTIETFDKTQVIVPNADFISGTVTNWTRGNLQGRAVVEVGVAYGTDTRRVEAILMEIAHEHPVVAHFPEPGVDFMGFGASSLDFRMRMILRDVNRLLEVQTEVRHRIAERFAEEGIEIPFAQQDIWLRNPEALRPSMETSAGPEPTPRSRPQGPEGAEEGGTDGGD